METYKNFASDVGSSVSTTIIYHRRKTFQVIGIHKEKGGRGKDITRRDADSLTMETRRVEHRIKYKRGEVRERVIETNTRKATRAKIREANNRVPSGIHFHSI
jgi:hypothetical protein